jgi:hypothetical protein
MTPIHYYLFLCGFILLALFAWMIKRRISVILSGGRATGYVVSHEMRDVDNSISYHPVFVFEDHNGIQRHLTSNAGWSAPQPQTGTKIRIRYHRKNPELAFIDSFYHIWFWPFVLAGFAAVLFFFAWDPNSCLNHPSAYTCKWDGNAEL